MKAPRRRRDRVRDWLNEQGFDALLVRSAANVRYVSGFSGEGIAVVGRDACAVSTDSRYAIEAREQARDFETVLCPDGHLAGAADFIRDQGGKSIAFEAATTTYAEYEALRKRLRGVKLKGVREVIEKQRVVKDAAEIALIRRAAELADSVLTPLLLAPPLGITEKEFALLLEGNMVRAGAEAPSFATIAAVGPSAAKPHATPGATPLAEGAMLKVDCGARVDGYCSDITRTTFLGEPTPRFREVYGAVCEAQQAAVAAVKPGVTGAELDGIARQILNAKGLGDKFGHGLGHGVGLEVHEPPRLSGRSADVMEKGMVVTIEPGVYIEGWGGVRIEDLLVVTGRGHEVLTKAPKWTVEG
jgi:Xaa-Pro aminopeptidase